VRPWGRRRRLRGRGGCGYGVPELPEERRGIGNVLLQLLCGAHLPLCLISAYALRKFPVALLPLLGVCGVMKELLLLGGQFVCVLRGSGPPAFGEEGLVFLYCLQLLGISECALCCLADGAAEA
jgi:hypothetical protein